MSATERSVTPQRATIVGGLLVNGPVVIVLLSSLWITARFYSGIAFFAVWFPFFAVAWIYWSVAI